MSEYTQQGEAHTSQRHSSSRTTVWSGWIWFAAIVMVLTGVFNAVEGLVALLNRAFYATNGDQLIVFDLTAWGWVHLMLGALVGLAGLALLSGATWARIVGVAVATLNAMAQVAFIPAYPVWSTIVITLSILVIWALVVHGREVPGDLP